MRTPRVAAAIVGARMRAIRPRWVTEAATRRSTSAAVFAMRAARLLRTALIRPPSEGDPSTSPDTERQGGVGVSSAACASTVKKGPKADCSTALTCR
ncbi:Uncharacterised protein [Mycobacteroides abscessus subsp. abscessus]|nr:Uncharacterised protein [Mycobacteroides abscessus subsp. abscessus]